jgi:hypothetical protein
MYAGFWWGNLWERDRLVDPGVDGDNIKMNLQKVGCGVMEWIDLPQDRGRWLVLVHAVMNLWVP